MAQIEILIIILAQLLTSGSIVLVNSYSVNPPADISPDADSNESDDDYWPARHPTPTHEDKLHLESDNNTKSERNADIIILDSSTDRVKDDDLTWLGDIADSANNVDLFSGYIKTDYSHDAISARNANNNLDNDLTRFNSKLKEADSESIHNEERASDDIPSSDVSSKADPSSDDVTSNDDVPSSTTAPENVVAASYPGKEPSVISTYSSANSPVNFDSMNYFNHDANNNGMFYPDSNNDAGTFEHYGGNNGYLPQYGNPYQGQFQPYDNNNPHFQQYGHDGGFYQPNGNNIPFQHYGGNDGGQLIPGDNNGPMDGRPPGYMPFPKGYRVPPSFLAQRGNGRGNIMDQFANRPTSSGGAKASGKAFYEGRDGRVFIEVGQ